MKQSQESLLTFLPPWDSFGVFCCVGELENSGGKKVLRDCFILTLLILSDNKEMEQMTEIGFGEEENARMEIY